MLIRRETITYSIAKNKKRQKEGKELLKQLQDSEVKLANATDGIEEITSECNSIKYIHCM